MEIIRATTFPVPLSFVDINTREAIDITGYTIWFTVRKEIPSTSISNDEDAAISIKQLPEDIVDPLNGATTIVLSRTDTNISPGTYFYDVQFKTPAGDYSKIRRGELKIIGDITRDD